MYHHPKYYKELRKLRNNLDQDISSRSLVRAPCASGPGLKLQAPSFKLQAKKVPSCKLQAPSRKFQAPSRKRQAP